MTLFGLRNNLGVYRDNVNNGTRLRDIQVKHNGILFNIERIEEDSKGDIVLILERQNFIKNIWTIIKFEFFWHLNSIEIWGYSVGRKLTC
jgi:hypothetical protein